jgi:DNA polymerase-3 subunit delta'
MWQVIGQDRILTLLKRSLKEGSINHAYLLVGPRHVGKKNLAVNLAQALNCDDPEPPCGQCRSCLAIAAGKHADVVSLDFDTQLNLDNKTKQNSKTEISIDDMRELHHNANFPPYEGKYKVFIIDNAEFLSSEAANSVLKILEEPPPKVVWLLLASEERRLLPTITSRCQKLELKPMPLEQIQQVLAVDYKVDPDRAAFLARLSHGCLGWALSALTDEEILKQRSSRIVKLSSLITAKLEERFAYAQELATQFSQDRRSITEVTDTWLDWWRDLMLIKSNCKKYITNIDYEMALEKQAETLTLSEIKDFLSNICLVNEEIHKNVNSRLAFEWLMLNLPRREVVGV